MAVEWVSTHLSGWENKSVITYAITDINSQQLLGSVGFVEINGSEAELGYWIGEPYWGNGYCTEAVMALVEFALTNFGITKIVAKHLSSNPASGKVMKKIGMRHTNHKYKLDRYGKRAKVELYELP